MENNATIYDIIGDSLKYELWDAINNAAGGSDAWGVHNNTLYYSRVLKGYRPTRIRSGANSDAEINGILELVIKFQKDNTSEGTPVFVVPLTKELHRTISDCATSAKNEDAYLRHDDDNVVVYASDGDVRIIYTSLIEQMYGTPQRNAFFQMVNACDGLIIARRPGIE